jgi:hypothetical protein
MFPAVVEGGFVLLVEAIVPKGPVTGLTQPQRFLGMEMGSVVYVHWYLLSTDGGKEVTDMGDGVGFEEGSFHGGVELAGGVKEVVVGIYQKEGCLGVGGRHGEG